MAGLPSPFEMLKVTQAYKPQILDEQQQKKIAKQLQWISNEIKHYSKKGYNAFTVNKVYSPIGSINLNVF